MSAKVLPEPIADAVGTVRPKAHGRASSFSALASPSDDSTAPSDASTTPLNADFGKDRRRWSWLANYPRLCFIALFVMCTYASGVFASLKLTQFALGRLDVPAELARARAVYESTGVVLNGLSACFMEQSLSHLALVRAHTENERARVQTVVDANDVQLETMKQQLHTCASNLLQQLQHQFTNADISESEASAWLTCLGEGVARPGRDKMDSELLLGFRAILLSQVARLARRGLLWEQSQTVQMLTSSNTSDSISESIRQVMQRAADNMTSEFELLRDIWQMSSAQSQGLIQAQQPALASLLHSGSTQEDLEVEWTRIKLNVHKTFDFLSKIHSGVAGVVAILEKEWTSVETRMDGVVKKDSLLRQEIVYAMNVSQFVENRTLAHVQQSYLDAEQDLIQGLSILRQQWSEQFQERSSALWDTLDYQTTTLYTNKSVDEVRYEHVLPLDPSTDQALEFESHKLLRRQDQASLKNRTKGKDPASSRFDLDVLVLQSALVDMSILMSTALLWIDAAQHSFGISQLTMLLLTESYSNLPVVDIRDVTSIQTLDDLWGIFACRHKLMSVLYTLATDSSVIMLAIVNFLVWTFVGVAGTTLLLSWKRDHLHTCGNVTSPPDGHEKQSRFQLILNGLFTQANESTSFTALEMKQHSALVAEILRNESQRMVNNLQSVANKQNAALDLLETQARTLANVNTALYNCSALSSSIEGDDESNRCENVFYQTKAMLEDFPTVSFLDNHNITTAPMDSCLPGSHLGSLEHTAKLQHVQHCAAERAVYLTFTTWWLWGVVLVVNRFAARMIIKAAGIGWWRYLSAGRLEFMGFCYENGSIQNPEILALAVQRRLHEIRSRVRWRFVGTLVVFCCGVMIWWAALHSIV